MKKAVFFLMILAFLASLIAGPDQTKLGKAADFTLPDLDGKNYQLYENLENGPVVINFWATWCVPCIEEMKKIKKLHKKYADDGIQFLAISVDDPKTVGRVESFAKSHRYPFTILLDTNNEVMKALQGTVPPYTVVIEQDGNITYTHVGYRIGDEKQLEGEIKKLLEKE